MDPELEALASALQKIGDTWPQLRPHLDVRQLRAPQHQKTVSKVRALGLSILDAMHMSLDFVEQLHLEQVVRRGSRSQRSQPGSHLRCDFREPDAVDQCVVLHECGTGRIGILLWQDTTADLKLSASSSGNKLQLEGAKPQAHQIKHEAQAATSARAASTSASNHADTDCVSLIRNEMANILLLITQAGLNGVMLT